MYGKQMHVRFSNRQKESKEMKAQFYFTKNNKQIWSRLYKTIC